MRKARDRRHIGDDTYYQSSIILDRVQYSPSRGTGQKADKDLISRVEAIAKKELC